LDLSRTCNQKLSRTTKPKNYLEKMISKFIQSSDENNFK
jgi:hypothetical protein